MQNNFLTIPGRKWKTVVLNRTPRGVLVIKLTIKWIGIKLAKCHCYKKMLQIYDSHLVLYSLTELNCPKLRWILPGVSSRVPMTLFVRSYSAKGCSNVCDAISLILAYLLPKKALYCLSSGTLFTSVVWMFWIR